MKRILLGLFLGLSSLVAFSQSPCVNGLAAGLYPCDNIDMLSHVTTASIGGGEMNDIWGWTDALDGKEYVLLGTNTGTTFFDISDPVNPILLGNLPTHTSNSIWRDIKVYQDYAFIVSEANNHGMQVFDLTRLRSVAAPPETFTEDAHYAGFGSAHNIVINPDVARAYGVGTDTFSGGMHIVDISNPLAPTTMGDYALDGYTHDAQVVTYNGPDAAYQGMQIALNSNEDALTIANVDDPNDTQTLSVTGYAASQYTHQGWITDDHTHFLQNDELDEYYNGTNTRTHIWDISDLDAPIYLGFFESTTAAIDHNLYIDGNLSYESNYRAGLRILDIQDVANANLSEVAYFDLYPSSNSAQFNGTWSNYPYFESGVVAVSHIEDGLFLLQPGFLHLSSTNTDVCDNESAIVDVTVEDGFLGPVNLSVVSGLPGGATADFSANNVNPGVYTLTLSNWPSGPGNYQIVVEGSGAHFTYSDEITINVTACAVLGCTDPIACNYDPSATQDDGSCDLGPVWFEDADNDGYGDAGSSTQSCTQPAGFVSDDTDCDDTRNDVYPDAAGTYEDVDNNCNGLLDPDELYCMGDYDHDGVRTTSDLLTLLSEFGCLSGCTTDLNDDGIINAADVLSLLSVYGSLCNP